jgi:hypothetical protein
MLAYNEVTRIEFNTSRYQQRAQSQRFISFFYNGEGLEIFRLTVEECHLVFEKIHHILNNLAFYMAQQRT